MFLCFVSKVTFRGIRFELGENVPDSGQEHTADSDDSFFVSAAGFYSAIAFPKFGMIVGFNKGVGDLNKDGFQIRTRLRNSRSFNVF